MRQAKGDKGNKQGLPNESLIARSVFQAAEGMGISDRTRVEQITAEVIKRLRKNQPQKTTGIIQPLPGMEEMIGVQDNLPSKEEIEILVKEILAAGRKPRENEEVTVKTPVEKKQQDMKLEITENALQVLKKRYLKKDLNGNPMETPEEMLRRVSDTIAQAELKYDEKADVNAVANKFYRIMAKLEFMPNSPTLMNAGRELGQLSACFVLPVEDSMESIFDAVKYTALIHKSGGGTGFSFSRLRPEQDRVGSTGGVASGPVSFMRAFDTATDVIKQGGMRRGANMGILSVDHPDIIKFITSKDDKKTMTNFNISVAITTPFMEAVQAGTDYDLINPHTGKVAGKLNAKEVFDKIVHGAWSTGDPGIVFIDRINQFNPTPRLGKIESTNPCGEQPLLPYESCNLGSINLAKMLKKTSAKIEIDYDHMKEVVHLAVRFLDNVIDMNKYPLKQIADMSRSTRKIGLGIMGYADMLIKLGVPYNSEEALTTASAIMKFIRDEARNASQELAVTRGVFPTFKGSIYDVPGGIKLRNASLTTIAPTGTISIIAGCSSGIEPLFALSYMRNILDGAHMVEVNPYFEQAAKDGGFYSKELMQSLAEGTSLHEIDNIPEEIKQVYVTAHDIIPKWHVRTQAAFQDNTDNAVSKTVNFSNEAAEDDIAKVYLMAYEYGLKGITIYRDGCRDNQVLTTAKSNQDDNGHASGIKPRRRAKVTHGFTEMVNTGCGHLYVTVNSDEEGIFEVFSHLGKSGGCAAAQLEAVCRLVSLSLRADIDVESIVRQLRGIRCPSLAWEEGKSVLSCADAIASVLEKHTTGYDGKPKAEDYGLAKNLAGQCPDCGNLLVYEEGCFKCPSCGYTKC